MAIIGSRLADIDRLQGFPGTFPDMLGVEAGFADPSRAAHQAEHPVRDMREDPVGNVCVEFGEPLLGYAVLGPQNAIRMGELGIAWHFLAARRRLVPGFVEHDILGCLVLPDALESGLPQQLVRTPAPELDIGNEARLDPAYSLKRLALDRLLELGALYLDGGESRSAKRALSRR